MSARILHGLQSGHIRIGTFSSVATHWLPYILRAFSHDYPGIDYELLLGDYCEVEDWLTSGWVDCGFVRLPTRPEFTTIFLQRDDLAAVLPADHPLAAGETCSVQALGAEPFILLDKAGTHEVAEALAQCGVTPDVRFTADTETAAFHPGRCAAVWSGDTRLGTLGQIHPDVCAAYGLDGATYCAEIDVVLLHDLEGAEPVYTPLPRFPAITRDIAVVCDAAVPVGELTECIRKAEKNVLRGVKLFDVYTGVGIPEGKKSVAFSLTLRSDDGTLTDDHAEEAVRAVLDALRESFGAVIR